MSAVLAGAPDAPPNWREQINWEAEGNRLDVEGRAFRPEYAMNIIGTTPLDTFVYIAIKTERDGAPFLFRIPVSNYALVAIDWIGRVPAFAVATPTLFWLHAMLKDMARQVFGKREQKSALVIPGSGQ